MHWWWGNSGGGRPCNYYRIDKTKKAAFHCYLLKKMYIKVAIQKIGGRVYFQNRKIW